jgi:septal ring factor EnvC (AmiA/AmiB activator)
MHFCVAFAEAEHAREKKLEALRAKLALESKLKEDVQSLKMRLEADLEEAEHMAEEDAQKRKRFEAENWAMRAEIEELR